jgi:hypothetical protein
MLMYAMLISVMLAPLCTDELLLFIHELTLLLLLEHSCYQSEYRIQFNQDRVLHAQVSRIDSYHKQHNVHSATLFVPSSAARCSACALIYTRIYDYSTTAMLLLTLTLQCVHTHCCCSQRIMMVVLAIVVISMYIEFFSAADGTIADTSTARQRLSFR